MKNNKEVKEFTRNKFFYIFSAIMIALSVMLFIIFILFIIFSVMKKTDTRDYFMIIIYVPVFCSCLLNLILAKTKFVITEDELMFNIKTHSDQKEYNRFNIKGLHIKIDDIETISFAPHSKTEKVLFKLKDGKTFEAFFLLLGKKQNSEILAYLKDLSNKKQIEVIA